MKSIAWLVLGICGWIAIVVAIFYLYPEPGACMRLSYLPC
jgi:hypothetical protein